MNTQLASLAPQQPGSLEKVKLEMALSLQDIEDNIDAAIALAADTIGGTVLFQMPTVEAVSSQSIAAIAVPADNTVRLLLVNRSGDGQSLDVEDAETSDNPLGEFARSHTTMMWFLSATVARAESDHQAGTTRH